MADHDSQDTAPRDSSRTSRRDEDGARPASSSSAPRDSSRSSRRVEDGSRPASSSAAPRDSSRSSKRDEDGSRSTSKRSNAETVESSGKRRCSSPQPGSSQQLDGSPPRSTVHASASEHKFDLLTDLLHGLIEKMDKRITPSASPSHRGVSGVHDLSPSDSYDDEISDGAVIDPDPLDDLEAITHCQSVTQPDVTADDDADFLKALTELSDNFLGEEAKGDPISDRLATIVNASLRRRPVTDSVKATASKIKLPCNVPNLKVPETNPAIVKAMTLSGKMVDGRLTHANGLLAKALVPIVQCLSDIGEKKSDRIHSYLEGLNGSLRLLISAINYINQLRKEVARVHVNDTALAELCKWECEVGTDSLFPFDIVKKCDEIHKTKKLGRPSFRPYKTNRIKSNVLNRHDYRRPFFLSSQVEVPLKTLFRTKTVPRREDAALQSSTVTQPSVSSSMVSPCTLFNTPNIFVKGKIFSFRHLWQDLSSDRWIHEVVHGKVLQFNILPVQDGLPRPINFLCC